MKLQFKLTFKQGIQIVAEVVGRVIDADDLTVADVEKTIETEQFVEKLTGLRLHIEQVL